MASYNSFIKDCYDKGYRVDSNGDVISPYGKKRKLCLGKDGYYKFGHRMKGKRMTISVHNLCAYQKFGVKCFDSNLEVRHLDGDSKNNIPSNIGIGTHSDNMNDIPKEIRLAKAVHASSFLKKYDYKRIKKFREENHSSYKELMDEFGITSKGTVSYIINSK